MILVRHRTTPLGRAARVGVREAVLGDGCHWKLHATKAASLTLRVVRQPAPAKFRCALQVDHRKPVSERSSTSWNSIALGDALLWNTEANTLSRSQAE